MTDDDIEPVMLSALQHYLFCPRQCALIHVEGAWAENYLTATGRILHERTDSGVRETRRDVHRATSLRLFSKRLGLTGVADVVEFLHCEGQCDAQGLARAVSLPGLGGWWRPFPVEYKRGRPKPHLADEVQLCAQAVCLEEMLSVTIDDGALFYGETRRRVPVSFDSSLRDLVTRTADAIRDQLQTGRIPPPYYNPGCDACSIVNICKPRLSAGRRSAKRWIDDVIDRHVLDAEMS